MDIDVSFLTRWIRAEHCSEDTLQCQRSAFKGHSARFVIVDDFLLGDVAARLAAFLAAEAEFEVEFGLFASEPVSEEQWKRADERDRFFRRQKLRGPLPDFRMSGNALTYYRFRNAFQQVEFKAYVEALTGLPLGPAEDISAHSMRVGDYLRPHSDNDGRRRIAMIIYLSPAWTPSAGGQLQIEDSTGVVAIDPEYNRLVMFDVLADTTHQVLPVLADTGDEQRLTIGGWYARSS